MATLRERYSARDGMGHANRPRRHDALGLDAQPRRLCLSSCWSRHANTNTNRNSYGHGNGHSHAHGNSNIDTEAHAHTEISADTETSSNTCPTPVALVTRGVIW